MYEKHFHLQCDPFAVSPDPRFLFSTPAYAEALAGLAYGIQSRKGMISLTGEVGTGKTLAVRCLLRALDPQSHACCFLFHSQLAADDILRYLLADLGQEPQPGPKSALLLQLSAHLVKLFAQGVTPVLILDEAQNYGPETLEEVRLLTNLETAETKLLQVVLVGQPELDAKLDSHGLRQLRQRIMLRLRLAPLGPEQTSLYIESRLRLAGHADGRLFTPAAVRLIQPASGGIPRLINVLCANALLSAFAQGAQRIEVDAIEEAANDLGLIPQLECHLTQGGVQ